MGFIRNEPNLRLEDYPKEVAGAMGKLFRTLTPFFTSIMASVNQDINFEDNIVSVTKDYDLTNVQLPINLLWTNKSRLPRDLRVMKAQVGSAPTVLIPAWSFDVSTFTISITQLLEAPGMSAPVIGLRYQFSVRATV